MHAVHWLLSDQCEPQLGGHFAVMFGELLDAKRSSSEKYRCQRSLVFELVTEAVRTVTPAGEAG